jgi:hypothetical protein
MRSKSQLLALLNIGITINDMAYLFGVSKPILKAKLRVNFYANTSYLG